MKWRKNRNYTWDCSRDRFYWQKGGHHLPQCRCGQLRKKWPIFQIEQLQETAVIFSGYSSESKKWSIQSRKCKDQSKTWEMYIEFRSCWRENIHKMSKQNEKEKNSSKMTHLMDIFLLLQKYLKCFYYYINIPIYFVIMYYSNMFYISCKCHKIFIISYLQKYFYYYENTQNSFIITLIPQ